MESFVISKELIEFEALYWVTGLKKPKNDERAHITFLYAKSGHLVSTDGAELREVPTTLPDGFYSILTRNKSKIVLTKEMNTEEGNFPDYESLFEKEGKEEINLGCDKDDKGLGIVIRAMEVNSFNPIKYMGLFEGMDFLTCHVDPKGEKNIYLKAGDCKAVLMPLRD